METTKLNILTKHLSQIDSLLKIFRLRNLGIETITPYPLLIQSNARFKTMKAATRKESIRMEANDEADL